MNSLDFLIIIPVAIGFIFGLFKGLIKELTSLVAIFLGIYGAKLLSPLVSQMLIKSFDFSEKVATPVAYLIIFVIVAVALLMLAGLLDKTFNALALGGLNKFLGGVFGGLKYALIVSVLLNVFNALDSRFSLINVELKQQSLAYKPAMKLAPVLWEESKKLKATNSETERENE